MKRDLLTKTLSITEDLRGHFKRPEFAKIVLPMVFLHRLGHLRTPLDELPDEIEEMVEGFRYADWLRRLDRAGLTESVVERIASLETDELTGEEMIDFVELLKGKFTDMSADTLGEHYTPPDLVELVSRLLTVGFDAPADRAVRIYDPTAGAGGLVHGLRKQLGGAPVEVYGQEINEESWAMAKAERLISGVPGVDACGNTLTEDAFPDDKFDIMIGNPPFGVNWSAYSKPIQEEHKRGAGRFDVGLPKKSDGQMLFIQHIVSKMHERSRAGVVCGSSPSFAGNEKSGEAAFRRFLIENDLLECLIQMPGGLFHTTSIPVQVWLLNADKPERKRGKVQFVNCDIDAPNDMTGIDAVGESFAKKINSKTKKKWTLDDEAIDRIVEIFSKGEADEFHSGLADCADILGMSAETKLTIKRFAPSPWRTKTVDLAAAMRDFATAMVDSLESDRRLYITLDETGFLDGVPESIKGRWREQVGAPAPAPKRDDRTADLFDA